MRDIEIQTKRTEEARLHADNLADEVLKAFDTWTFLRKKESESFAAYLLEERILSAMKKGE